jgi:uncharacterized protein (DUF427 family)
MNNNLVNMQIKLLNLIDERLNNGNFIHTEQGNYYLDITVNRDKNIMITLEWNGDVLNSCAIDWNIYEKASAINFYYENSDKEDFLTITATLLENYEI